MYAYNPRKISPEKLESSLVGDDRWDTLNRIQEEMRLEAGEGPKQHWMLVGPRGIGKSHLMTLLYHKIKKNECLNEIWIPILFPEELKMTKTMAKFLERAFNEIILEFGNDKDPVYDDLRQKIEKVRKSPIAERSDNFFSLISWFHEKTGKFIALLAENLQQLLGKKIPIIEQKKLRAFLQTSDALLLIGSATTIFSALHDHSHPFYHFFHSKRLHELNYKDMKSLILNLLTDSGCHDLANDLRGKDARIRTFYSFTGGNPRMAVFLADILKAEVPDEMLELMDKTLDQLTPYFDSIFKDTPDYLEDVLNTLAAYEPAQSPKEIAQRLEAPPATIRNYLKQLKEIGHVRVAFSKRRSNYYCLTEYLYRIWYQMRDSGHREETRWLMELLLMLYSPGAIIEEKNRLKANGNKRETISPYEKLIIEADVFIKGNPGFRTTIELCLEWNLSNSMGITTPIENKLFKRAVAYFSKGKVEKAISVCEAIVKNAPYSAINYNLWGFFLASNDQFPEAIGKFKKAIEINPKFEGAYIKLGAVLFWRGEYDEAMKNFKREIEIKPDSEVANKWWGECLVKLGKFDEAQTKFDRFIELKPDDFAIYLSYGELLEKRQDKESAILKYLKHIYVGFTQLSVTFDFIGVFNKYILPILKDMRPTGYIKQFHSLEDDNKFSKTQLAILLTLLGKYDSVVMHISDSFESYQEKDKDEKEDLDFLIFTIKLCVLLRLSEGNINEALRLFELYLSHIQSLEDVDNRANEVTTFMIDLFKIQIGMDLVPEDVRKIMSRLQSAEDVPFSNIFIKILKCISEPDSVETQRYLNDKAIANVVNLLKDASDRIGRPPL